MGPVATEHLFPAHAGKSSTEVPRSAAPAGLGMQRPSLVRLDFGCYFSIQPYIYLDISASSHLAPSNLYPSDPAHPEFSNSFDLLFREVELVTGGQRLHRCEDYLSALAARNLSPEPLAGYLEAFKHGMPPHGGFAIGLERWVAALVGVPNIRAVALFPRDRQRLTP